MAKEEKEKNKTDKSISDIYKDLANKYKQTISNRRNYGTVDVGNFLPTINEMMQEDCMIDLLNDFAENVSKDKDGYKDVAFYASEPFATKPGYYQQQGVFVLAAGHAYSDSKSWLINNMDGDTLYFSVDTLDSGGSFVIESGGNKAKYEDYQEYAEKQLGISSGGKLALRLAGIDAPEIPHYGGMFIEKTKDFKEYTIKELEKMRDKGIDVNFIPYIVNRTNVDKPDTWTITERNSDDKIKIYETKGEDGEKSYYEIVEKDILNPNVNIKVGNYMEITNTYLSAYEPYIVVMKNDSDKNTVLDGYKAQQRLRYLLNNLVDETNGSKNLILVLDNNVQSFDRTFPTFAVFQSLYKFFDNVKNLISTWDDAYSNNVPISRLNYRALGVDAYNRSLGSLYANIKTDNGTMWIDVAKYILVGSDFTEAYPNFTKSSELSGISNAFSDVLNLQSYSSNSIRYLDDLDANGEESYIKRNALHKELTGIDFEKVKDCTLMIGDFLCLIPPQNIRNVNNVDYEKVPIIRGKGSMVKNKANREQLIEIDLYFYGNSGINGIPYQATMPDGKTKYTYYMNGLRALLAQFRLAPFLPIENQYINEVLGITVVALVNFAFSTVEGFPHLLKATLTLRDFNYEVYMPDLPLHYYDKDEKRLESISESDQIFGRCFEWELFRYYYQRGIMNGEDLSKYDFNSYEYGDHYYSHKNLFHPNDLTDNYMELFIPDEQWLKNALQYKKSIDYSGQIIADLTPTEDEEQWLKDVASIEDEIFFIKKHLESMNEDFIKYKASLSEFSNNTQSYEITTIKDMFKNANTRLEVDSHDDTFDTSSYTGSYGYKLLYKHINNIIIKKLESNPIIDNVVVNESETDNNKFDLQWDLVLDINTDSISSNKKGDISNVKEMIKTLAGKNKVGEIFVDNKMHIYITAKFKESATKNKNYYIEDTLSVSQGDDLNGVIRAYGNGIENNEEEVKTITLRGKDLELLKSIASIQDVLDSDKMQNAVKDMNKSLFESCSIVPSLDIENYNSQQGYPSYNGKVITIIFGGSPIFSDEEKSYKSSIEKYSNLDSLGRCGPAFACLGIDLMPNEERGDISNVKPTGWHNNRYDFIESEYLYNRCHLIGFQLAGENDNVKNLITGTNYFNVEGMLPYENLVANFIKSNPKMHVYYKVTPVYRDKDLVAKGVKIEAASVEDDGALLKFAVFVHNVQPGVSINYSDGTNKIDENYNDKSNNDSSSYTIEDIFNKTQTKTDIRIKNTFASSQELLEKKLQTAICNLFLTDYKYCKSIKVNECFKQSGSMSWEILLEIDTEKANIPNIKKAISILTDTEEDECFKDNFVTLSATCLYSTDGYIARSLELKRSSELKTIITEYYNYPDEKSVVTNKDDSKKDNNSYESTLIGTNQGIFDYTKYKEPKCMKFIPYLTDKDGISKKIDLDAISFNMSNTFTEMYLKAVDGYAPQFMGGSDIVVEAKFTTTDKTLVYAVNKLAELLTQFTKTYRRVMPCAPLKVKNSYMQTVGLNEMLLDNVQVETIDGVPGAYSVLIRMTSVDRSMRQREALKKLDSTSYTATITDASIVNMFALKNELSKAELYPDLDLPTIQELEKIGWKYLKYINDKRLFVDPDFYIIYSFKYTSQMIKETMYKYVYKLYLGDEGLEKLHDNKNKYSLEDSSFVKLNARFDNELGSTFENANDFAEEYDRILNDIDTIAENEKIEDRFVSKGKYQELKDLSLVGNSLTAFASMGLMDGWIIRSENYNAVLADFTTNTAISKLDKSGLDNSMAEDFQKNDKIYEDIYDMRCRAIELIDKILEKGLVDRRVDNLNLSLPEYLVPSKNGDKEYTKYCERKNSDNIEKLVKSVIEIVFINDEDGKELIKLLNSNCTPNNDMYNHIPLEFGNAVAHDYGELYDAYNKPSILIYIQGFMCAAAYALNGNNQKDKNGRLLVDIYDKDGDPYILLKDTNVSKGEKIKLSNENNDWEKVMNMVNNNQGGGSFGLYRISTYKISELVKMLKPNEEIKYRNKNTELNIMYRKSAPKGMFCEDNAFIDPYYNYAGHRSTVGKDYKQKIIQNPYYNAEAFLRIVLMYLRRMIIEGLFFNEIDVSINEYVEYSDDIIAALKSGSNIIGSAVNSANNTINNSSTVQLTMGNDLKKIREDKNAGKEALSTIFGTDVDQTIQLLNDLPDIHKKICCARMIYPFIAAITNYDKSIMKYILNRDYDTLNTFTNSQSVGSTDNAIFSRFLEYLSSIRMLNSNDVSRPDTSATTSVSQKINNLLMQEAFTECSNDPRQYVLHSFYDMVKNDKRGRLLRAFPTYYIVFMDEGRKIGSWKLFDNFYNMSSISELQVVKSRKIPADTCTFTMSNSYMSYAETYDNSIYQQYVDIYGVKDLYDSIMHPSSYVEKEDLIRKRKQLKDTTVLSPGVRIHVRLGYGADASSIPIVFNGKIAEVEFGETVQVVCQGDGHELCNPLNALGELTAQSFQTSQHMITAFKDIRGSFMRGGESPRNLSAKLLNAEYNGVLKTVLREMSNRRFFATNPFGIYHFGDKRFQDIFEDGETVQNLYEVSNETLLGGYNTLVCDRSVTASTPTINCTLQDKTYWEILNLCANSGDGYYAAIRDFGFRSTVCLCKANHYYAYEYNKDETNGVIYERRKPFQQFHYCDSYNDIIYNTMKATEKNMKTNAIGTWQSTDFVWGTSQDTVGPIFLDMNIYPEYQKSMTVDTGLVAGGNGGINLGPTTHLGEQWNLDANDDKVNKSLAEKVTTNVLRQSVKDMYDGEICIMGSSSIKPFDSFCFVDTYEDMTGTVEVETVIHSLNATTGFTTTIIPDLVTCTESIEQKVGAKKLYGSFIQGTAPILVSGAFRMAINYLPKYKTMTTTGSRFLINSLTALQTWLTGRGPVANASSGVLNFLKTMLPTNPVGAIILAVAAASTYILVKNVKDAIYRTLRNIQAITVFPVIRNQRPLIAGMAGHRGSVYGYSYPSGTESDSIQGMVDYIFNDTGVLGGMLNSFMSDYDMQSIFDNWRQSLLSNDNELMSDSYSAEKNKTIFMNEVYNTISKEFSNRSSQYRSLKSKVRINNELDSNKIDDNYLNTVHDQELDEFIEYQIGGIYDDKDNDKYSKVDLKDKEYVTLDNITSNVKLQSLLLVEDDDEIRLAIEANKHSTIKQFMFAHNYEGSPEVNLLRESGNRKVRYLVDRSNGDDNLIYDLPLLHTDAMVILKLIINEPNLNNSTVTLNSGVRVNDTVGWNSTGFTFTLSSDNFDGLKSAAKSVREDTKLYSSSKDIYVFDYIYDNNSKGVKIMVYAPRENKVEIEEDTKKKQEEKGDSNE